MSQCTGTAVVPGLHFAKSPPGSPVMFTLCSHVLDALMKGRPRLILEMEVLAMNVSEVSAAFRRMAFETPELVLEPHADNTLVSDQFDVDVTATPFDIRVAEPDCGNAVLTPPDKPISDSLWTCQVFITALQMRRNMLMKLTHILFAELPDFPRHGSHVSIFRLADLCNVHVTMVARAIQGKVCRTPFGLIPYTQFITSMRK